MPYIWVTYLKIDTRNSIIVARYIKILDQFYVYMLCVFHLITKPYSIPGQLIKLRSQTVNEANTQLQPYAKASY